MPPKPSRDGVSSSRARRTKGKSTEETKHLEEKDTEMTDTSASASNPKKTVGKRKTRNDKETEEEDEEEHDQRPAKKAKQTTKKTETARGNASTGPKRGKKVHAAEDEEMAVSGDEQPQPASDGPNAGDEAMEDVAVAPKGRAKTKKEGALRASASTSSGTNLTLKCDADSLSVILSLLNTSDFLAAIRTDRAWYAARLKHTAWPKFNVGSFIQSLRDDNYADPSRRRLYLAPTFSYYGESPFIRALAHGVNFDGIDMSQVVGIDWSVDAEHRRAHAAKQAEEWKTAPQSLWRHASDVKLSPRQVAVRGAYGIMHAQNGTVSGAHVHAAMRILANLPYLQALNLQGLTKASPDMVQELFQAISARAVATATGEAGHVKPKSAQLQALVAFEMPPKSILPHLPLLADSLLVLALGCEPYANQIAPLKHLQYLHYQPWKKAERRRYYWNQQLDNFQITDQEREALGRTIRILSTDHALRSLSIGASGMSDWALRALLRSSEPKGAPVAAGTSPAIADWSQPACLTDLSFTGTWDDSLLQAAAALPHLTRLQTTSVFATSQQPLANPNVVPPHAISSLQQLRLALHQTGARQWCHQRQAYLEGVYQLYLNPHVSNCSRLRVLELYAEGTAEHGNPLPIKIADFKNALQSSKHTIEEVRVGVHVKLLYAPQQQAAGAAAAEQSAEESAVATAMREDWSVLTTCTRLRVLEIPYELDVPTTLWVALGSAPAFQTLVLTLHMRGALPPLLPYIASSKTWCSLHLYGVGDLPENQRRFATQSSLDGLKRQLGVDLDEATAQRLRVHTHGARGLWVKESYYALRRAKPENPKLSWCIEANVGQGVAYK